MIAPRTNLVVWAAAIIFPLSILAGVFGSFRAICILGIVIFGLASLIDLLLGLGRYLHLEVQLSPVNRVIAGRHFQLNLKLSGTRLRRGTIRLVVDLPASIETDQPHTSIKIDSQISDLNVPIEA